MKCIGFGEFEGKCNNETEQTSNPNGNPYWCERCNQLRIKHLDKQMNKIKELFDKK